MTTFKHRTSSGKKRTRHAIFEALEDRRLLAAVTLDPSTIFQTVQGFGTAAVYPTNLVTIAQAGAIMRDAGMSVVRVTPSANDYTYTVGGSMSTPVPISANLDDNVARFNPGDNSQVDLINWLKVNGLQPDRTKMIGALWSPPHWMKITTGTNISWNGGANSGYDPVLPWGDYGGNTGGGRVNPTMWTDWARYVLSTVESWQQKTGLPMYAFSFQNEPNVPTSYNSCTFDILANDVNNPSAGGTQGHWDIYGDAVQALANELALHPEITTKFFGPELSQLGGGSSLTSCNPYNLGNYNSVRQNLISRGLLNVLGGWATHEYTNASGGDAALWDAWYNGSAHAALIVSNGTSNVLDWLWPTPGVAGDNKEIWQTETEGEDQTWTKDGAMAFGLKIQNALVYGHVSGYTSWTLTGYNSTDTWGLVSLADINNPTNSYKFDAMKQFSRWINPGAQRIGAVFENGKASIGGANELDTYNGLTVSAYNQAQDKRLTMVFTNMETSDQPTTITIPAGLNIATFQVFVTSGTQKYVQLANLTPSGGKITLTIPASSFVTITGSYATMVPPTVATAAAATPSPAIGTTTILSVLGADGTGEANLTYTWSVTSKPTGAADPTFTVNGTNAAKNTTATFSKAGSYQFTVTLTNVASLSVTSTVTVTVNQTATSIAVSPSGATVAPNGQKQFSVTAYDQFGTAFSPSSVVWSNSNSNLGAINAATGLYTTGSLQGIDTVTATLDTLSSSATVNVSTLPAPSVCYRLDDGSGTTAADSSGNNLSGTLVNGPTWTTGEVNGGLALNGTSQYVTVPALNLNSNTVTMSGWVKRNGSQSDYTGIVFYRNGSGTASGISMLSSGALAYHWNDTSSSWGWSSGLTVPNGVWTFVALVITSSNATMYMQPAGAAMSSATNTASNAAQAFSGVSYIGQDPLGGRFFKGSVDDVRIYNASLSAGQVAQLYSSYFPPTVSTAASANPATVAGTTSTLSVQGASSVNLTLTYTWSAIGTPPAPVAFSPNNSNPAKNTTATFSKAGAYTLGVTIVDTYGQFTTSSVSVTVNQTLTSIAVSPATVSSASHGSQTFTATAYDQFTTAMSSQPSFNWSAVSGVITAGAYTAPYASGSDTVTAAAGGKTGTAAVTITNAAPTVATAAAATPSPATGTTADLSVLGADSDGGGEANLSYTWSITSKPTGAANPTFSVNGSNAAKSTTATFSKAGSYSFTVTITDLGGRSTTSSVVNFTVNQTLTSIAVSPATASLASHGTQAFTATAYDQFGAAMGTQPGFTWSLVSGVGGIDTSSGLYTASYASGSASVRATSGSINGTASVTVTNATPTVPTAASTTPSPATGTTTALSVLGADDAGESNLSYTWSITSKPTGAADPIFSINGSNAAKSATATFSKAGSYSFLVTITDQGGLSTTSPVSVTVNQTPTSPLSVQSGPLAADGTVTFTAAANDQFGDLLSPQPQFNWALSGGGALSAGGVFTPPYCSDYNHNNEATITATGGTLSGQKTIAYPGAAQLNASGSVSWNGASVWTSTSTSSVTAAPGIRGVTGDLADFATGAGGTVTLDNYTTPILAGITFADAGTYTIAAPPVTGGTLHLDSATGAATLNVEAAAAQTISAPLSLDSDVAIAVAASGSLTLSGRLSGKGHSLTVSGPGTVLLSGPGDSGIASTTVTSGTLIIQSSSVLADGGSLTVGDASAFAAPTVASSMNAAVASAGGNVLSTPAPQGNSGAALLLSKAVSAMPVSTDRASSTAALARPSANAAPLAPVGGFPGIRRPAGPIAAAIPSAGKAAATASTSAAVRATAFGRYLGARKWFEEVSQGSTSGGQNDLQSCSLAALDAVMADYGR